MKAEYLIYQDSNNRTRDEGDATMKAHVLPMALSLVGVILFYLIYTGHRFRPNKSGRHESYRALVFKGLATLCAAALGAYGAWLSPTPPHMLLAAGLVICTAADVILGIDFMIGMAVFGLGHVAYSLSYVLASPPGIPSLIGFLALSAFVLLGVVPWLRKYRAGKPVAPFAAYAMVLAVMLALAIPQKPVLLAGAFLFVVSDAMLAGRVIAHVQGKAYSRICLLLYYLAQYLIAASTLAG